MQLFQDLGTAVEQRWRGKNYNEETFPQIAAEALAAANATTHISPWEIIRHLHVNALPFQKEDKFSDLPIILYHGPRFHIDVYFWLDGTTSVHQHGFSGAFQVLSGSSIHSVYSFTEEQKINPHFMTGHLSLKEVQLLRAGDVRPIRSGRNFIHSLFHLDRPSVTVTIRTLNDPAAAPQFDYVKPYLAINPFFHQPVLVKQLQSVALLLRMKHPEADTMISELLSSSDFETAFVILKTIFQYLTEYSREMAFLKTDEDGRDDLSQKLRLQNFFETARVRHGALIDLIPPILFELQRQDRLIRLRRHLTSNEHRFFLALLLNISELTWLLQVVKQFIPEKDPVDTVCRWVSELATTPVFRMQEPNALGVADFTNTHLAVLRLALKGMPATAIAGALALEPMFVSSASEHEVEKTMHSLRQSLLLKSILEPTTSVAAIATT